MIIKVIDQDGVEMGEFKGELINFYLSLNPGIVFKLRTDILKKEGDPEHLKISYEPRPI